MHWLTVVNGAGWSNPAGFATGFAGVGVGVGIFNPRKTRTPSAGCGVLFGHFYSHFLRVLSALYHFQKCSVVLEL
jgi:hypothetical protein